jgi:hypothetical protein
VFVERGFIEDGKNGSRGCVNAEGCHPIVEGAVIASGAGTMNEEEDHEEGLQEIRERARERRGMSSGSTRLTCGFHASFLRLTGFTDGGVLPSLSFSISRSDPFFPFFPFYLFLDAPSSCLHGLAHDTFSLTGLAVTGHAFLDGFPSRNSLARGRRQGDRCDYSGYLYCAISHDASLSCDYRLRDWR